MPPVISRLSGRHRDGRAELRRRRPRVGQRVDRAVANPVDARRCPSRCRTRDIRSDGVSSPRRTARTPARARPDRSTASARSSVSRSPTRVPPGADSAVRPSCAPRPSIVHAGRSSCRPPSTAASSSRTVRRAARRCAAAQPSRVASVVEQESVGTSTKSGVLDARPTRWRRHAWR